MNPKKQQILNAAHSLFTTKGYMTTSLQDILDEAKVSKGTFYHHFAAKSDCLMAIIESIISEVQQRRRAAAANHSADDPEVLVEQLSIRLEMNRQRNLHALYESIFHTQEPELKSFAISNYKDEVYWLAHRIVDLFGEGAEPYALDHAAILHGSMQHLIQVWNLHMDEEFNPAELARYLIGRLTRSIGYDMAEGNVFLKSTRLPGLENSERMPADELSERLQQAARAYEGDGSELLQFLSEELAAASPRPVLMESALTSLGKLSTSPQLAVLLEQTWRVTSSLQNHSEKR